MQEKESESIGSLNSTLVQNQHQPLPPILDPTHLEVLLPISLSDNDEFMQSSIPDIPRTYNMQTRLQYGTIDRKDYSAYYYSVPEL